MSPVLIFILVDMVKMNYRIAWGIALCATGAFNYITLKLANQKKEEKEELTHYQRNIFYIGRRIQSEADEKKNHSKYFETK
jgi:hypothetical protein